MSQASFLGRKSSNPVSLLSKSSSQLGNTRSFIFGSENSNSANLNQDAPAEVHFSALAMTCRYSYNYNQAAQCFSPDAYAVRMFSQLSCMLSCNLDIGLNCAHGEAVGVIPAFLRETLWCD